MKYYWMRKAGGCWQDVGHGMECKMEWQEGQLFTQREWDKHKDTLGSLDPDKWWYTVDLKPSQVVLYGKGRRFMKEKPLDEFIADFLGG